MKSLLLLSSSSSMQCQYLTKSALLLFLFILLLLQPVVHSACPNLCSQHGECSTQNPEFGICICDIGYTGNDCSKRICPKSYNPISINSKTGRRQLRLTIGHKSGSIEGDIEFGFMNDFVMLPANANLLTSKVCTDRLSDLRSVDNVTCDQTNIDVAAGTGSYIVTFHSFPMYPYENNLHFHAGNPLLAQFSCNSTFMKKSSVEPKCTLEDIKTFDIPEYAQCGGNQAGNCDAFTGICGCRKGFFGPACDDMVDNGDIEKISSPLDTFSGTLLHIKATRNTSSKFNFMLFNFLGYDPALENKDRNSLDFFKQPFSIRGDGIFNHTAESATFRGGGEVRSIGYSKSSGSSDGSLSSVWSTRLLSDANANSSITAKILDKKSKNAANLAMSKGHVLAVSNSNVALSISNSGNLINRGKLESKNFKADLGIATALSGTIAKHLDVDGSMNIGDSIVMGVNFAVTSSGITLDSSSSDSKKKPSTLLRIKTAHEPGNHSLVEVRSSSISAKSGDAISTSLFRSTADNKSVFGITSTGELYLNHLIAQSRIEVDNGGVVIEQGGLELGFGSTIDLTSGTLEYPQGHMSLSSMHVSRRTDSSSISAGHITMQPLLELIVNASNAASAVNIRVGRRSVKGGSGAGSGAGISSVIRARKDLAVSFNLDDSGSISSLDLAISGSMQIHDVAKLNGVSFRNHIVTITNNTLLFPSLSGLITVAPEHDKSIKPRGEVDVNVSFIDAQGRMTYAFDQGKLLIVRNDLTRTYITGYKPGENQDSILLPKVSPKTTVLFVYDGTRFVDIQAISSNIRSFNDVTELSATNSLDIGNVTLTSERLVGHNLVKGRVPFASDSKEKGRSRHLQSDQSLSYSKGQLVATALSTSKFIGDVDFSVSDLIDVEISNSKMGNTIIKDSSVKVANMKEGLVAVDPQGGVSSTGGVGKNIFSSEGMFVVTELRRDISFNHFSLNNVDKVSANVMSTEESSIENLKLDASSSQASFMGTASLVRLNSRSEAEAVWPAAITTSYKCSGSLSLHQDAKDAKEDASCQMASFHMAVGDLKMYGNISGAGPLHLNRADAHKFMNISTLNVKNVRDIDFARGDYLTSTFLHQGDQVNPSVLVSDEFGAVKLIQMDADSRFGLNRVEVVTGVKVGGSMIGGGDSDSLSEGSRLVDIKVDLSSVDFSSSSFKSMSIDSLHVKSDILNDGNSVFLTSVNKVGELSLENTATASLDGNAIKLQHLRVNSDLSTKGLKLNFSSDLRSQPRKDGLLAVSASMLDVEPFYKGSLFGKVTVARDVVLLDTARLHISGVKSASLLAVDENGVLVSHSSIAGQNEDAALSLGKLSVKLLESYNVEATNVEVGNFQFVDPVLLLEESNKRIKASAATDQKPDSLLAVSTESGKLSLLSDLSINEGSFNAKSSIAAEHAEVRSLQFNNLVGGGASPELSTVLVSRAAEGGLVSGHSRLSLVELELGRMECKGDSVAVDSLVVLSLGKQQGAKAGDSKRMPVSIGDNGSLETSNSLDLKTLTVSKDTAVTGSVTSNDIFITSSKGYDVANKLVVPSVVAGNSGLVTFSSSANLSSINSMSIENSGEVTTDTLRLKSLQATLSKNAKDAKSFHFLSSNPDGIIDLTDSNELLLQLSKEIDVPDKASFGEVYATNLVIKEEMQLPRVNADDKMGLLESDLDGNVKATSLMLLEKLEVQNSININGLVSVKSLSFLKSNFQMHHGLVAVDGSGDLYTIKDITVSNGGIISSSSSVTNPSEIVSNSNVGISISGNLASKHATIDSLTSELNAGNHTVRRATFSGATVTSCDIHLPGKTQSKSTNGQLLFKDTDTGKLSVVDSITLDSDIELLKVKKSIGSLDVVKHLEITKARMKSSIIHSSTLKNVASIKSDRIDFTGLSSANGGVGNAIAGVDDVDSTVVSVGGDLIVQGAISGRFIDSSDIRLKKDIKNITKVLDKVLKLQAVSYNNRVDEFPKKHLSSARQVGWIADDLKEVFPDLVVTDRDGLLAVKYDRSFPILFEALKDAKADLDARFDDLDARISRLKGAR